MELTELIHAARAGDKPASDRLFALVYDDLHRLAARQLQPLGGMATTSLVHEAYLKLARPAALDLNDRQHFFAVAARAMRQIAINHIRERLAAKRGGGVAPLPLEAVGEPGADVDQSLLDVHEALDQLSRLDTRLADVVECRFFAGYTEADTALALGVTERTVRRDWVKARAWLRHQIAGST